MIDGLIKKPFCPRAGLLMIAFYRSFFEKTKSSEKLELLSHTKEWRDLVCSSMEGRFISHNCELHAGTNYDLIIIIRSPVL